MFLLYFCDLNDLRFLLPLRKLNVLCEVREVKPYGPEGTMPPLIEY